MDNTNTNNNDSEGDNQTEKIVQKRLDQIYNEYYLSQFQKFAVNKFIKDNIGNRDNPNVTRIREWLLNKINLTTPKCESEFQRGCPEIIPGLTATPWWDNSKFEWISKIEENYSVIKEELLSLKGQKGFQPYRAPSWASKIKAIDGVGGMSHESGEWNIFYLFLHDMRFEENCKKCPKTVEIIEKYIPRQYNHAFFSALTPNTHITKHNGPTNKKLRLHLPLVGIEGSSLTVAGITKYQEAGKCYIFDDSFEHEAQHNGKDTRIILIVDFWHPDLSNEEIKFLNLLQKSKMKYEKQITEMQNDQDNFFSIIETSKDLLKSDDWWTINAKDLNDQQKIFTQQNKLEEEN